MRGMGQIAELCEIAEPDVAAITNVGPVHLELLGTIEAIAEAKAEIIAGLGRRRPGGASRRTPRRSSRTSPTGLATITFGAGGEVFARDRESHGRPDARRRSSPRTARPSSSSISTSPTTSRTPSARWRSASRSGPGAGEMARRTARISFSRLRGERLELPGGSVLINDCYNANPISMHAALDHLASLAVDGRRIAVLGGMAELGPDGPGYHHEAAAHARSLGIGPIVGVGELARDYAGDEWAPDPAAAAAVVAEILGEGDAILVKGSRSVGLEAFAEALRTAERS